MHGSHHPARRPRHASVRTMPRHPKALRGAPRELGQHTTVKSCSGAHDTRGSTNPHRRQALQSMADRSAHNTPANHRGEWLVEGVAAASVEGHSGAHDHPHRICGAASAVNAQGGATHPALVAPPPHRGRTIRSRYTVCPHSFTPSFPFSLAFGAHYEPCWPRRCTHSHGTDLEHHPSPCRFLPHHRYRNQRRYQRLGGHRRTI